MSDPKANVGQRRWAWRLVVVLILAVGIGGFIALQKLKPRPAVHPPVKQLPLVRAEALRTQSGALSVVGHGLVRPRMEVVLAAEVAGRIVEISPALVSGGSFRAGEVLVRLDPAPFRAALDQARADRTSADAALRLAEQLVQRTRDLITRGFLSRQTLDERVAARDQANAALMRARALERQREIDLERTRLLAPFTGRVLSEKVDVGDTVQPGKELARIFAARDLEIAVSLTDRELSLVSDPWKVAGASTRAALAVVSVEHGGRRYGWDATVDRVEASVDSATRTFNIVVRVRDPLSRGRLLAGTGDPGADAAAAPPLVVGMYASVEIAGRDQGDYFRIPRAALRDGSVIWVLDAGKRIRIVPVRVLSERDESVAIAARGLSADAQVVVTDLRVVTEGLEVRVVEAR